MNVNEDEFPLIQMKMNEDALHIRCMNENE